MSMAWRLLCEFANVYCWRCRKPISPYGGVALEVDGRIVMALCGKHDLPHYRKQAEGAVRLLKSPRANGSQAAF
jgi:hypothetical protein